MAWGGRPSWMAIKSLFLCVFIIVLGLKKGITLEIPTKLTKNVLVVLVITYEWSRLFSHLRFFQDGHQNCLFSMFSLSLMF